MQFKTLCSSRYELESSVIRPSFCCLLHTKLASCDFFGLALLGVVRLARLFAIWQFCSPMPARLAISAVLLISVA